MASSIHPDAHRGEAAGGGWRMIGAVLRRPHRGWRLVERAPASVAGLFVALALPLAAIGPLAGMFHDLRYGRDTMGIIQYRPTPAGAMLTALVEWIASLVLLAVLVAAIGAIGRRFGGKGHRVEAAKVAVVGSAAFFLAAVFAATPATAFLQLLGLYGLFLLAVGTPRLMKTPEERATTVGIAVAAVALVLVVLLYLIDGAVAHHTLEPTVRSAGHRVVVTNAPAIAGAKLSAPANDKKGAVAPGTAAINAAVVPASSLQALLPDGVEGFRRTSVESQSSVSTGVATSQTQGTYVADTNSFTLAITDAGQPGALATNDSVIAGEVNRSSDSGYQRSRIVNGVRVSEKWSYADHGGSYSRTVGGRFTVEARGTAPGVETLRAAVASVDAGKLAALGH